MSEQANNTEEQLVVLSLDNESYGVNISAVREIVRMQHITKVPRAPVFIEGVTNLRGQVIPVLSLRNRFGLRDAQSTESSRIVVVQVDAHTIGLVVDGVSEVLTVPVSAIEPPSSVVTTVDSTFLCGIARLDEKLVMLLSLAPLIGDILPISTTGGIAA